VVGQPGLELGLVSPRLIRRMYPRPLHFNQRREVSFPEDHNPLDGLESSSAGSHGAYRASQTSPPPRQTRNPKHPLQHLPVRRPRGHAHAQAHATGPRPGPAFVDLRFRQEYGAYSAPRNTPSWQNSSPRVCLLVPPSPNERPDLRLTGTPYTPRYSTQTDYPHLPRS
jgi:hypothetical protein